MFCRRRRRLRTLLPVLLFLLGAASPALRAQPDPEPNDSPQQAFPMYFPYYYVSGGIGTLDDVDYYSFVGEGGREVTIWLETATIRSELSAVLALYDATGRLLAYNEAEYNLGTASAGGDPILYVKLPSTGTYYAVVTSSAKFHKRNLIQEGTTGFYFLSLFSQFDSTIAVGDGYEPNDSRAKAFPLTLPVRTFGANLTYVGDVDWYSFSATKGQRITIDVEALEVTVRPTEPLVVQTRLGVFDDTGRLVKSSVADPDPDTGFAKDPALILDVPKSGKYYVAVTQAADSEFNSVFRSPDFLADPKVSGAAHSLGYYELRIRLLQDLYFPHFANGDFGQASFATSFLLVNTSNSAVTGRLNLFKTDGTPFETTFVPSGAAGSFTYFEIPANGAVAVRTDGKGSGTTGYAVVTSAPGVAGSAVFSQYGADGSLVTEAGVGTTSGMDFFTYPVEVRPGTNTGIALANLEGSARANLYLSLVNSAGKSVATRSLSLDPGKQTAVFVGGPGQLFPAVTDLRGSLQVTSDVPVHTVALRSAGPSLTTLPPARFNQSFQSLSLNFPQLVAGTGSSTYRSTIVLTNTGYFPVSGSVRYTRSDGTPMPLITGSTESATVDFNVPPQATVFLESRKTGALETGFATVRADHGLGGVLIFSQYDSLTGALLSEVGVSPAESAGVFYVFAQNQGSYTTGLAVANVGTAAAALTYRLHTGNEGRSTTEFGPLPLAAGRHRADLVAGPNQLFPDFAGVAGLEVESSVPIPAVALRITPSTMTALPMIRIR